VEFQESDGAAEVAEYHEVFAEDANPQRHITQVVDETDGLPEPAQIFSARRAGPGVRELGVFSRNLTVIVGAEASRQEGRAAGHVAPPLGSCVRASRLSPEAQAEESAEAVEIDLISI
jgi:hypothetical protein